MKRSRYLLLAVIAGASLSSAASADMGSVKILAPLDNAQLDADEEYPLNYEIALGAGDDHFHVWIDDKKSPAQRALKGTYTIPKLSAGKHVIYIKVVDKGHVPTGPEKTIHVTAK
jgi:hypothetical protein